MKLGWFWIFPGIGAVLLACAVTLQVVRVNQQAQMQSARGEVVDLTQGCPAVRFITASNEPLFFLSDVCSNPPAFGLGDSVAVLYDPAQPSRAKIDGFLENWFVSLVLGSIGSVFLLISSFFIIPPLLARRRAEHLSRHGTPVFAELTEVRRNEMLSVNGMQPWRIVAQWVNPATGKLHRFTSANLWFDPSPYIRGNQVQVFIDPQKPKRYSVDTSFLPELAED
jgi:hypothetical protein